MVYALHTSRISCFYWGHEWSQTTASYNKNAQKIGRNTLPVLESVQKAVDAAASATKY